MFARFNENPAMTLQDIKETKRYGQTHGRMDNVKTVYPPQTKFAGGINYFIINLHESMGPDQTCNPLALQSDKYLQPDTLQTAPCGLVCFHDIVSVYIINGKMRIGTHGG